MNKPTTRRSATERAYETLRQAAHKLNLFDESELRRIGKTIRPDLDEIDCSVFILEDFVWRDDPKLPPSTHELARRMPCEYYKMKALLVFFRETSKDWHTSKMSVDIRLVLSFPRSEEDPRPVYIDAETGLPWRSRASLHYRATRCSEEDTRKFSAQDSEDYKRATAELREIQREKLERIVWVEDVNYNEERVIQSFVFQRRKKGGDQFETVHEFATRYHPAGSALFREGDREAYRQNFLRQEQERMAA